MSFIKKVSFCFFLSILVFVVSPVHQAKAFTVDTATIFYTEVVTWANTVGVQNAAVITVNNPAEGGYLAPAEVFNPSGSITYLACGNTTKFKVDITATYNGVTKSVSFSQDTPSDVSPDQKFKMTHNFSLPSFTASSVTGSDQRIDFAIDTYRFNPDNQTFDKQWVHLTGHTNFKIVSKPVVSFSAAPNVVASNGSSALTWSIANSPENYVDPLSTCTASGDWSGTKTYSLTPTSQTISAIASSKTFSLQCTKVFDTISIPSDPVNAYVGMQGDLSATLTASPSSGTAQFTSTLTAGVSGGLAANNQIRYVFNCGNGTLATPAVWTGISTSANSSCTYSAAGNYTASVSATSMGVTANATANVVASAAPVFTCGGSVPSNAVMCDGTSQNPTSATNWSSVGTSQTFCPTTFANICKYYLPPPPPPAACSGTLPVGATACSGTDQTPSVATNWTLAGAGASACPASGNICKYYTSGPGTVCSGQLPSGTAICSGTVQTNLSSATSWTSAGTGSASCPTGSANICKYYSTNQALSCSGTVPVGGVLCSSTNQTPAVATSWSSVGATAASCSTGSANVCNYYLASLSCGGSLQQGGVTCPNTSYNNLSVAANWSLAGASSDSCPIGAANICAYYLPPQASCNGSLPSGATPCAGTNTAPAISTDWSSVGVSAASCPTTGNICKYYSNASNYCGGTVPNGSAICPQTNMAPSSAANWTYTGTDSSSCPTDSTNVCKFYSPSPSSCANAFTPGGVLCPGTDTAPSFPASWTFVGNSASSCPGRSSPTNVCKFYFPNTTANTPDLTFYATPIAPVVNQAFTLNWSLSAIPLAKAEPKNFWQKLLTFLFGEKTEAQVVSSTADGHTCAGSGSWSGNKSVEYTTSASESKTVSTPQTLTYVLTCNPGVSVPWGVSPIVKTLQVVVGCPAGQVNNGGVCQTPPSGGGGGGGTGVAAKCNTSTTQSLVGVPVTWSAVGQTYPDKTYYWYDNVTGNLLSSGVGMTQFTKIYATTGNKSVALLVGSDIVPAVCSVGATDSSNPYLKVVSNPNYKEF